MDAPLPTKQRRVSRDDIDPDHRFDGPDLDDLAELYRMTHPEPQREEKPDDE